MKKIYVITGTPGAGKTSVLNAASAKVKANIVNYADVMLETGKSLGLGNNHDALRKLPLESQKELQKKAAEKIASSAQGITIVDTHCTVRTANGYLPGLPEWVIKALNPVSIIVVDAKPREILSRREKDSTRHRDKETLESIKLQQEINYAAAIAAATLCGATVKIIENRNNNLGKAAEELAKILGGN